MTILDNLLNWDLARTNTFPVGNTDSTNILDVGISGGLPASSAGGGGARDMGISDAPTVPKLYIPVLTSFTSGGSPTLQVALQGAPDAGNNTPGTFTQYALSQAYALATLIAGIDLWDIDLPQVPPGSPPPRFYKLTYIVATAAFTGGTFSAFLIMDRMNQIRSTSGAFLSGYPAGVTIAN
jgi:hypothetical protein